MRTGKFSFDVHYNGEELTISGTFYPPSRGLRERGTGLQLEPDEDAEWEIESVMYKDIEVYNIMCSQEDEDELQKLIRLAYEEK